MRIVKAILPILLLSLAALLGVCSPERARSATVTNSPSVAYIKPFLLVFYRTIASPEVARLAERVSSDYGLQKAKPLPDNPACCVWLEVKPNSSKPGMPYYAVEVKEDGGGMLIASSPELLEKAVDRLKESAHSDSGKLVVPVGKFS